MGLPLMNATSFLFLINLGNLLVLEGLGFLTIVGGIDDGIRHGAIVFGSLRVSIGALLGIENVLTSNVVLAKLEDGLAGPFATDHDIELGEEEAEKSTHKRGHNERNHCLNAAQSTLVGVGEPKVREGTGGDGLPSNGIYGFGEVVQGTDDQDS